MRLNKKKITFLLDKSNDWIKEVIKKNYIKKNKKFLFKISLNPNKVKNQDVVFILNYTKILSKYFLKRNKLNLVIHSSNLPKGKGFAPLQWQILKNKNKITLCLIEAVEKVDSGPIIMKKILNLKGDELNYEIRSKQADTIVKIINLFLKKYPKVKRINQVGKSTFYRRRYPNHSQLDLNKSIKDNFNLLRIVNNENYPAYFIYKNNKYFLKIFKESNLTKK